MPKFTLAHIAETIGAELQGDPTITVDNLAPLDKANSSSITFLSSSKYRSHLSSTQAAAVIIKPDDINDCVVNKLLMADPYLGFARTGKLFQQIPMLPNGIHTTAIIGVGCEIADSAAIGPNVVIGDRVIIGENTQIHANTVIGSDVSIGGSCCLWSNVTIYYGVVLGDRVSLHAGVVIGADGFGLANNQGRWEKIPQLGGVIIENDVEVGANTTIDRGALENTIIHCGVKIDNQVQIGHNVEIGENTAIAGCAAIAGSTKIGRNCLIAGKVGINGHIEIVDQVILTPMTGVANSIKKPGIYSASTLPVPISQWRKNAVRMTKIDEFVRRLLKLEQKVGQYHDGD